MLRINEIQVLFNHLLGPALPAQGNTGAYRRAYMVGSCPYLQPSPHPPAAAVRGHCPSGISGTAPLYSGQVQAPSTSLHWTCSPCNGSQFHSDSTWVCGKVWIIFRGAHHCLQPCLGGCWGACLHCRALCPVLDVSSKRPCFGSVPDSSSSGDTGARPSLASLLSSGQPCRTDIVPCSWEWSGQWWHGARRRSLWKWSCAVTQGSKGWAGRPVGTGTPFLKPPYSPSWEQERDPGPCARTCEQQASSAIGQHCPAWAQNRA